MNTISITYREWQYEPTSHVKQKNFREKTKLTNPWHPDFQLVHWEKIENLAISLKAPDLVTRRSVRSSSVPPTDGSSVHSRMASMCLPKNVSNDLKRLVSLLIPEKRQNETNARSLTLVNHDGNFFYNLFTNSALISAQQMVLLGFLDYHLMPRRDSNPVSRVAPEWDLWRTLYRLSHNSMAWQQSETQFNYLTNSEPSFTVQGNFYLKLHRAWYLVLAKYFCQRPSFPFKEEMIQIEKNNHNSSNSLFFGLRPQTKKYLQCLAPSSIGRRKFSAILSRTSDG